MIKIGARLVAEIKSHAEREYPRECCGLLVGRIEDEGRTRVVAGVHAVENTWGEGGERNRRMLIAPQEYMRAERRFAAEGLGVVGNYHSHPEHAAVPSQFDLENLAPWPTMSYVVVSVVGGRAVDLRSWELQADRSRFIEEEISEGS
ncbi:MAG TPA: M67 family metallopeptidase [Pyrinomonadaceae bacterium]|nr:M67 family metallopeptidase [Pyrinomonadaceae bacterium]